MNYSSVYIAGSSPRRSRWMDARNSLTDFLRITVPAGLHGTFTIEGSNDAATIAAELALNPAYSDDSAASFVDVTGTCTFDSSLTVTGGEVINGTYGGSYDYIRVRWVQTSGTGDIIVVVSDSSMGGGGNVVVTPSDNPYDIRHFLPVGETLSASNWRQAFENAKQAAFAAATNDTAFPAAANGAVPEIFVPEGTWPIEGTPLTLTMGDGDLTNAVRPGLAGAWQYGTVFVDKLTGGASHDGAIRMGYSSDSGYLYTGGRLSNFTVVSDDQSKDGVGIHVKDVLDFKITNVTIRGYSASTDIDRRGINLIIDSSFPTLSPNQHVQLDNVWCAYGLTGAKFDVVANLNIKQLNANGNIVAGVTYDQVSMIWVGGNSQYGGSGEAQVGCPIYGVPGYAIRGGANKVVASGATGTIGASSGSTATLTLPGIGQDFTNIGCMVRLKGVVGTYNNTLVEIIDVPASNQVTVAAAHLAAESNVTWELRTQRGLDSLDISSVYFETANGLTGGWFQARMNKGGGNRPIVALRSNIVQNTKYLIDLRDCASADVRSNLNGTTAGVRLRNCLDVSTDLDLSVIDVDDVTRPNLLCRKSSTQFSSVTTSFPFSSDRPAACSAADMLVEMGAAFVFAPRRKTSLTLSGSNLQSATDLANGIAITPTNAGIYPTRVNDSALGGYAMQILGNATGTGVGALKATIPANKLPQRNFTGSLIVVGRLNSVSSSNGRVTADAAGERALVQTFNNSGAGYATLYGTDGPTGSPIAYQAVLGADTEPYMTYIQGGVSVYGSRDCDCGSNNVAGNLTIDGTSGTVPYFSGATPIDIRIGHLAGQGVGSDFIALVAFVPNALSAEQMRLLRSAIAVEFKAV